MYILHDLFSRNVWMVSNYLGIFHKEQRFPYIYFFFLFWIDFADAMVTLILAFITPISGSQDSGKLGIFLFCMTILSRILVGIMLVKTLKEKDIGSKIFLFLLLKSIEITIEDSASIILLVNTTDELVLLSMISMYLTLTNMVFCISGFLYLSFASIYEKCKGNLSQVSVYSGISIVMIGSASFLTYILLTEVLMERGDTGSFSGSLKVASFIIYGIASVFVIAFSFVALLRVLLGKKKLIIPCIKSSDQ